MKEPSNFEKWFLKLPKKYLIIISLLTVPLGVIAERQFIAGLTTFDGWRDSGFMIGVIYLAMYGQYLWYRWSKRKSK